MVPAALKCIWLTIFVSALPIVLGKVGAPTTKPCSMDFSPCTCIELLDQSIFDNPAVNVTCNGDVFLDGDHLKATLRRPLVQVGVHLILRNITFPLPVNLLGRNTLESLEIDCLDNSGSMQDIHLESFEDTAFEATSVTIRNCNLTGASFRFLSPFNALKNLAIHGSQMIKFVSFPQIPELSTITFNQSTIEEWSIGARVPNLKRVVLVNIGREQTLRILDNLVFHEDLASLTLLSTNLDAVPAQVKKFKRLLSFKMEGNSIKILKRDAIQWEEMPRLLVLSSNGIERIESGAFQGNFSSTKLVLSKNKLMTVDADIFKPMLESMVKSGQEIGSIDLEGNPFNCDCDISWLVTSNRHLLRYLNNAKCTNGTAIATVQQYDLPHCKDQTSGAAATSAAATILTVFATLTGLANNLH